MLEALKDRAIIVKKPDGSEVRGTLIGVTEKNLVVQIADGRLIAILPHDVEDVTLASRSPPTRRKVEQSRRPRARSSAVSDARKQRELEDYKRYLALQEEADSARTVAMGTLAAGGTTLAVGAGLLLFNLFVCYNPWSCGVAVISAAAGVGTVAWGGFQLSQANAKQEDADRYRRRSRAADMPY